MQISNFSLWAALTLHILGLLLVRPATTIHKRNISSGAKPFMRQVSRSFSLRRDAISYIISPGDNAPAIAAKYSTTVDLLQQANPGISWNSLRPGQNLNVPSLRVPLSYNVSQGDTGNSVSAKYGISFPDLAIANPNASWLALQVGDTLQVPGYGSKATYTVALGDNVTTLTTGFGNDLDQLREANQNIDWTNLQQGDQIQIPPRTSACPSSTPSSPVIPSTTPATVLSSMLTTLQSSTLPSSPATSSLSSSTPSSELPATSPNITVTSTPTSQPSSTVTQAPEVTGDIAVSTVNDSDGTGSLSDTYNYYTGDGSNWPTTEA